ncbi:MAG: hypothetical protein E7J78_19200, partial [Pantoea sp.]|nr:hypothetical protein [Pantoea sp.]
DAKGGLAMELHGLTLLSFLAGGVAGIWLYKWLGYGFLLPVGFGLMALALKAIFRPAAARKGAV